jgi:hypothetical protein
LGAVGVAEAVRVRAQLGRASQEGSEDVQLIRGGGAGQDADAPQAGGAERAALGQAAFGLLDAQGAAPFLVAAQDLQLGAQPRALGVQQVGGLRQHQPPERPAHQRDQRGLEHPGAVTVVGLLALGRRLRAGQAGRPDQPVQVGQAAVGRPASGARGEQQRLPRTGR